MMMKWDNYGVSRRESFEEGLTPGELAYQLERYQEVLGEDFGIRELLQLEDIRSKALIAEAINDVQEFLVDQIGKMRNSHDVDTIAGALQDICEIAERIADQ